MPWPSYGNAYAGQPSLAGNAITVYAHRGGSWQPVGSYAHRGGSWQPTHIYPLPAELETDPPPPPTTTVVNITDLLIGSETLSSTVNCTGTMKAAIDRLIFRVGPAASVTTDHVTVDLEDTIWRCENALAFPNDSAMKGTQLKSSVGIGGGGTFPAARYFCQNWPKGVTIRNGGTKQTSKDGFTLANGGVAVTTVDRNRYGWRIQQGIKRPDMSNNEQWLEFLNFTFTGALTYAVSDNYQTEVLPREGQEGLYLSGAQWVRLIDPVIEQPYGDCVFTQDAPDLTQSGRDYNVTPGMIEILGGRFERSGIMNITLNTIRAPDAVFPPGWWRSTPDTVDVPDSYNSHPSASGLQYGLWWHGNVDHPFTSINTGSTRGSSIIDMEAQNNYSAVQDVRVGADDDAQYFRFSAPDKDPTSNFTSGTVWCMIRRYVVRHVRRIGAANIAFSGSPGAILDEHNQATRTLAVGSTGIPASGATFNVTVNPANSPSFPVADGRMLVPTTVGHTHVRYTTRSTTGFTGCSGGAGTTVAGTVRNASIKRDGCNIAAGSNGVVLGAKGSPVGGTGILNVDNHSLPGSGNGMNPSPHYVRVWTTTGLAVIACGAKVGTNQWKDCTVAEAASTGMILRTGQAVTYAFDSTERLQYTSGDITVDDFQFTMPSQSKAFEGDQVERYTVINCDGPYRPQNVPFAANHDVPGFNKGGPSQFGSNNFFLP